MCLATKAIHLESVGDYTTTGFLVAFRRFVNRRDVPAHMCDNGTNFHDADRKLQTSFRAMSSDSILQVTLMSNGVQWHLIHSAAFHFGDLWEAGVKSFKFHLRRVIGSHTLSKLEFMMLLYQIETCLNSQIRIRSVYQ
jgi:hypothetical protein